MSNREQSAAVVDRLSESSRSGAGGEDPLRHCTEQCDLAAKWPHALCSRLLGVISGAYHECQITGEVLGKPEKSANNNTDLRFPKPFTIQLLFQSASQRFTHDVHSYA